jgi:hypothetical protein
MKIASIVIDARSMSELARLHLPARVPFGVHGCWLDAAQIDRIASIPPQGVPH